ncbi:unnamed protein product, partial [Ilex paraguariensis]
PPVEGMDEDLDLPDERKVGTLLRMLMDLPTEQIQHIQWSMGASCPPKFLKKFLVVLKAGPCCFLVTDWWRTRPTTFGRNF